MNCREQKAAHKTREDTSSLEIQGQEILHVCPHQHPTPPSHRCLIRHRRQHPPPHHHHPVRDHSKDTLQNHQNLEEK